MGGDEPPLSQNIKSKLFGLRSKDTTSVLPQHNSPTAVTGISPSSTGSTAPDNALSEKHPRNGKASRDRVNSNNIADNTSSSPPPPAPPPVDNKVEGGDKPKQQLSTRMRNGSKRFLSHFKGALLHSWINVLLIFVPLGIAVKAAGLGPEIVFSMNAIAIIPLAGLLAHATEAVAARLGDTLGALLNVSFGNAVELILFIILLAGDQIRVVQAALLGSILANLLLILGMAFLFGGLRFQEQVRTLHHCFLNGLRVSLSYVPAGVPHVCSWDFVSYANDIRSTTAP